MCCVSPRGFSQEITSSVSKNEHREKRMRKKRKFFHFSFPTNEKEPSCTMGERAYSVVAKEEVEVEEEKKEDEQKVVRNKQTNV